jgi:DNA/RNA-binding domain of Phe-tRNA-synthetase-like protein
VREARKRLYLAPDFASLFPEYIMFTVVARRIDNTVEHSEIVALLRQAEARVRADPVLQSDVAAHPRIASWRGAFRRFGVKPADYRPSIDSLLRRVVKGWEAPYINTVVALSNAISLKYLIPSGSDDLERTTGDLGIRLAKGSEPFQPFNAPEVEYPQPGEVIWADDEKVMCRRWIWRQGDQTKVTSETESVTINLDILPPVTREEGTEAVQELADLVRRFAGGEVIWNALDRDHREELL